MTELNDLFGELNLPLPNAYAQKPEAKGPGPATRPRTEATEERLAEIREDKTHKTADLALAAERAKTPEEVQAEYDKIRAERRIREASPLLEPEWWKAGKLPPEAEQIWTPPNREYEPLPPELGDLPPRIREEVELRRTPTEKAQYGQMLIDQAALRASSNPWNLLGAQDIEALRFAADKVPGLAEEIVDSLDRMSTEGARNAALMQRRMQDWKDIGWLSLDVLNDWADKIKMAFLGGQTIGPITLPEAGGAERVRATRRNVIHDGKEYSNSFALQLHMTGEQISNDLRQLGAAALDIMAEAHPDPEMREMQRARAEELRDRASVTDFLQRGEHNRSMIAAHSDWLLGHDIALAWIDDPEKERRFYEVMNDTGFWPSMAKLGVAMGDATGEVLTDPGLLIAAAPWTKTARAIRKLAVPVSKRAEITRKIALEQKTEGAWRNALDEAERHLDSVWKRVGASKGRKRPPTVDELRELQAAENNARAARQAVESFRPAGPHSPHLVRDTRRQVEAMDTSTTKQMVIAHVDDVVQPDLFRGPRVTIEGVKVPRSAAEIRQDLVKQRVLDARMDVDPTLKYFRDDVLEQAQAGTRGFDIGKGIRKEMADAAEGDLFVRAHVGGDGVEEFGDALSRLVRTGGAALDDIEMGVMHPEDVSTWLGMPQLGVGRALISQDAIDAMNNLNRAQEPYRRIRRGATLGQGVEHHLRMEQVALRRALKDTKKIIKDNKLLGKDWVARQTGLVTELEGQLENLNKARTALAKQGVTKEMKKGFDKSWLPPATHSIHESPEAFNNWLKVAGDRVARGLYPGSLRLKMASSSIGGYLWNPQKEPMRFFELFDPEAYNALRANMLRYDWYQTHWTHTIADLATEAGITKKIGKFDPKKSWGPIQMVDEERGKHWFRLLNTAPDSAERAGIEEAAKAAVGEAGFKALVETEGKVRKYLDWFADMQGVTRSSRYLEGYIHHVFDKRWFAAGARPPTFAGAPKEVRTWAAHLMDRTGPNPWKENPIVALDIMGRAGFTKMIMEPAYNDILRAGLRIQQAYPNSNALRYTQSLTNNLMGRRGSMSQQLDHALMHGSKAVKKTWYGGQADRALLSFTSAIWASTIAGNPRYALMQIANGVATTAGEHGLMRTSRALWQMATPEGQAMARQTGVFKSFEHIWEIMEGSKLEKLALGYSRMLGRAPLPVSVVQAENFVRGTTALASIDMQLTRYGFKTWQQARAAGWGPRIAFEAMRSSEEINHLFGILGRPAGGIVGAQTLGRGPTAAGVQYLGFIPKQSETLLKFMDQDPGAMIRFLGVSGFLFRAAANWAGIDIGEYVGFGYIPKPGERMQTAPGVDVIVDFVDMISSSWSEKETSRTTKVFLDDLKTFVPLMQGLQAVNKNLKVRREGVVRDSFGRITHIPDAAALDVDLGGFRPKGGSMFNPLETRGPALGSDKIALWTGQRSIQEGLSRLKLEQMRADVMHRHQERRHWLEKYVKAVRDDNVEGQNEAIESLIGTGMENEDPLLAARKATMMLEHYNMIERQDDIDALASLQTIEELDIREIFAPPREEDSVPFENSTIGTFPHKDK